MARKHIAKIETRFDGWKNLLTGLGFASKDKRIQSYVEWERLSREESDQLFAGDEIIRRICTLLPSDAMAKGYEWVGIDKDRATQLDAMFRKKNVNQLVLETDVKSRQYGGACMMVITQNMQELSKPLGKLEQVLGFVSLSMWELNVQTTDIETNMLSPDFGYPRTYSLNLQIPGFDGNQITVHRSRLIRFDGEWLPRDLFLRNGYWHDSTINKVKNAVMNYETSHDSLATLIQDFSVGVWKLKNLAELVAAGKEAEIVSRIRIAQQSKSAVNAIILDADMEDFTEKGKAITGLPESIRLVGNRLVAATGYPHTILLGESPDGSNATGNSTTLQYYDLIKQHQENKLKPRLISAARLLDPSLPDDLDISFKPLWQMDEKEQAEVRKVQSETDARYMEWNVVSAQDVAKSRFGGDKYSLETKLTQPVSLDPIPAEPQA